MFKMLVFAMLSSASGWGLPSLLSSDESTNIMGGVDGARDGRQLASGCDRGCNGGCDWSLNTIPFSCDDDCDRGCDGGGATAALAPASGSGLSRCPAPVLSPQTLRNSTAVPACPQHLQRLREVVSITVVTRAATEREGEAVTTAATELPVVSVCARCPAPVLSSALARSITAVPLLARSNRSDVACHQ